MTSTKIKEHIRELIKLCKAERIVGTNTGLDGYYVSFKFEPEKTKCGKCGK